MRCLPILMLFPLMAACGADPASETPVALKPGNYDVWVRGGAMIEAPNGTARQQVCLGEWQARDFPQHPLEKTVRKWNGCSDKTDPPRGNQMSGTRTCPKGIATFNGEHGEDRFTIRGTTSSRSGAKEEPFTVTGRRTGDC